MEVVEPGPLEKRAVGFLVRNLLYRGRRGGPWEVPARLNARRVTFVGNSGARLVGLHFAASRPRGIVVLAHPDRRYGKHWFVREGWIEWLHSHGFDALTFDFPVYGESRGGSTYLHDDVVAACREARRLRPELPVHLVGLSVGAYAALNASPRLDFVESLAAESPYPNFEAWYEAASGSHATHRRTNAVLRRLFPRTYARIDACANLAMAKPPRILIAGTAADEVTPIALTRQVAAALPEKRGSYREYSGVAHLSLFTLPEYREALLSHLVEGGRQRPNGASPARAVSVPAA